MSKPIHPWEERLRDQVKQHEFDFDPQAWAGMEALLEQANGTPCSDVAKPAASGIGSWKVISIISTLTLLIGVVLWWNLQPTAPESITHTTSTTNGTENESTEVLPEVSIAQNQTIDETPQNGTNTEQGRTTILQPKNISSTTISTTEPVELGANIASTPEAPVNADTLSASAPVEAIRQSTSLVEQLPSLTLFPVTPLTTTLPGLPPAPTPQKADENEPTEKRKRNRKTLFPDVTTKI